MQLADLIASGDVSLAPPQGKGDGKAGGKDSGTRFDEVVQLAIVAAEELQSTPLVETSELASSIIAIGIPANETVEVTGEAEIVLIDHETALEVTQQDESPAKISATRLSHDIAENELPEEVRDTSRAADALADEVRAIQDELADVTSAETRHDVTVEDTVFAAIQSERVSTESSARNGSTTAAKQTSAKTPVQPASVQPSVVMMNDGSADEPVAEATRAAIDVEGVDESAANSSAEQSPNIVAKVITKDDRSISVDRRSPESRISPSDSTPDKSARTVEGATVLDSSRAADTEHVGMDVPAVATSDVNAESLDEQMVLPLDVEADSSLDEKGRSVSTTSIGAETAGDRSTTSARPVLAPRSIVSAAWLRAMMEQGLQVHSEPEGWNSVTMRLGEEDGTMTVRTRREDGAVAVHVVFSDPNLRAMAAQQIDRLEAVLQKQYDTSIDLSLSDAGANANGQRDDERTSADGGRATLSPQNESTASPRRSLWARNEWVV